MTSSERVCASVQLAFEEGDGLMDWQAEHLADCAGCQAGLAPVLAEDRERHAAPVASAARLDAALDALVSPSPAPASRQLPWSWIVGLALASAVAVLAGNRHPSPQPESRDAWRARPHSALSPAELPLEALGDSRAAVRGVSE